MHASRVPGRVLAPEGEHEAPLARTRLAGTDVHELRRQGSLVMPMKKILVATDLSEPSRLAIDHAARLAAEHGSAVTVLHVFDERDYERPTAEVLAEDRNSARLALDAVCGELERAGRWAVPLLADGRPDEIIPIAAETDGARLIVVGSLGKGAIERLLVGSVAERVVRRSRIPVLVARPPVRPFGRILVATDFSTHATEALDAALELAAPGAEVELLHVVEPVVLVSDGARLAMTTDVLRAEREVLSRGAELLARPRRDDVTLRFRHEVGRARWVILDQLGKGYDLVALGSHGRRGLRRLILGSVAESIVRHAPCSVLVAPAGV
jgi:nucleotide-binding universal stress UspA family protein